MKCQCLFSAEKNKKNITYFNSAEFAHKVVTVKGPTYIGKCIPARVNEGITNNPLPL